MEKVTEIVNSIKERISNPLIFSFICSWLVTNWPITIGLIWYDPKQIEKEGYVSIFGFIKDKINLTDSLCHPLFFALGYTIFIPILKNAIKLFDSWISKWGDNWNLKIIDGGKISINKYLNLRADYEKRSKILEEVITTESAYRENYNLLQTEKYQLENKIAEISLKLDEKDSSLRHVNNVNSLNGTWENNYEFEDGKKGTEIVSIENGKYYKISKFGERVYTFDIRDFCQIYGSVFFIKEMVSEQKENYKESQYYNFNRLRFIGKDILSGTENVTTKIQYTKK